MSLEQFILITDIKGYRINFFQHNSPASIGGWMNADVSCFSLGAETPTEASESLRWIRKGGLGGK